MAQEIVSFCQQRWVWLLHCANSLYTGACRGCHCVRHRVLGRGGHRSGRRLQLHRGLKPWQAQKYPRVRSAQACERVIKPDAHAR